MQDREICLAHFTEGVGDFPVLHILPVFDFISHFYQLFLVSCLFDSYVLLADDVNNVSYFPSCYPRRFKSRLVFFISSNIFKTLFASTPKTLFF